MTGRMAEAHDVPDSSATHAMPQRYGVVALPHRIERASSPSRGLQVHGAPLPVRSLMRWRRTPGAASCRSTRRADVVSRETMKIRIGSIRRACIRAALVGLCQRARRRNADEPRDDVSGRSANPHTRCAPSASSPQTVQPLDRPTAKPRKPNSPMDQHRIGSGPPQSLRQGRIQDALIRPRRPAV